ncbi:beta-1,3-glucanase [Fomitopsis serialis]|uniref:beta-1,3-glucanase n=1 Tax=Fomitopsis serialis TaxID=139415 RepID=UPI0020083F5F|nr:beta-1,3-glucanase [Neoantrodia serialis]KAH9921800.1 beta-1,3-glucanase [Neoantrodia serialis]
MSRPTFNDSPVGPGNAAPGEPYWMERVNHQGVAAFNPKPDAYQVFRNVKDFGAVGDGRADDTEAINAAMSYGGRCGGGNCESSTVTPAICLLLHQLIGDARAPPTLLAGSNFSGMAVIDADPYIPGGGGAQWYINQNNFFRSVRNFVIDTRRVPDHVSATGIHWQVSQATSLMNIRFVMSDRKGNAHQGIWMENGSGGYMGGKFGMWVGNQQFTVRNVTMTNCETAVYGMWNWVNNCQVGFDLKTGGTTSDTQTVGAEAIIDAVVSNTPVFVRSSVHTTSLAGSLVLNNVQLTNVPVASWVQGNVYEGANGARRFVQGHREAPVKAKSVLDAGGKVFGRMHPQYEDYGVDQIVSAKSLGAKGDGRTDDTRALQRIFNEVRLRGKEDHILDHGTYYITDTLFIPAGTQLVGEAWTPAVMVRAGERGSKGILEISDIVFATRGPAPGAIVLEWNVHSDVQGGAGMWDSHIRSAGTNLERAQCPLQPNSDQCYAAFLAMHLTPQSNAYLEGTWVWLADHDLDGDGKSQITVYSGRGVLSESQGPVWMVGTAEHHTLYQYNFVNARDHYLGLLQTESPYYQPSPPPPAPFAIESRYKDPTFPSGQSSAWAVNVQDSHGILIFGAGLYSFFSSYGQACLKDSSCQSQLLNIDAQSSISVYSLSTVGVTHQLSVGGRGIVPSYENQNGFQSTMTAWTR